MDCIEEIGYDNDIKLRDDLIAMPIKRAPDQVCLQLTQVPCFLIILLLLLIVRSLSELCLSSNQQHMPSDGCVVTNALAWLGAA